VTDVSEATFGTAVLERSMTVPVIVDLWAEWCGPCKTLGPILEKVVAETNGGVELAKVDVDANPRIQQAFQVQSIPAVFAIVKGQIVDQFIGAQPEHVVRAFVEKYAPGQSDVDRLLAKGDADSIEEAFKLDPANPVTGVALAGAWLALGRFEDVLILLEPFPATPEVIQLRAQATLGQAGVSVTGAIDDELEALLARAKADEEARARLLQILDALGPSDPRYVTFRRRLANALY
jgi:putative thioredoxin